jgi:sterol desaturase/sphingolipid hydroxylase (fatty acid hydroxylase superfamily)
MMDQLTQMLSRYGLHIQIAFFTILFIVGWNIENIAAVVFNYRRWKHVFVNGPFVLTNIPVQLLLGIAFAKTIEWTTHHQFGFLYYLPQNTNSFFSFIVIFVFLDLGEYIYHVIMHKVKRLWMFHIVHHSDHVVDVSTTFREHPGENIIRLSITLFWIFIFGGTFWMFILRQIIQSITTLFAHINYRLPDKLDNVVGLIFITPNLHQVHHHYKQPYTDCNYGDVLSIWDRLFGTFKKLRAEELVFGVDTYMKEMETNSFKKLVKIPFGKYRKTNNGYDSNNKKDNEVDFINYN